MKLVVLGVLLAAGVANGAIFQCEIIRNDFDYDWSTGENSIVPHSMGKFAVEENQPIITRLVTSKERIFDAGCFAAVEQSWCFFNEFDPHGQDISQQSPQSRYVDSKVAIPRGAFHYNGMFLPISAMTLFESSAKMATLHYSPKASYYTSYDLNCGPPEH